VISLRISAAQAARAVGISVYALIVLLPIAWIALTAFKRQIDILLVRVTFTPTLANVEKLLFDPSSTFWLNLWNSVFIASATTAFVVFVCALAAFTLAGRNAPHWIGSALLALFLFFHIVPPITFLGSWFTLYRELGLYNTLTGLVLANAAVQLPIGLWLAVTYSRDVPRELIEAAEIDGCTRSQVFLHVFLPIVRTGLAATAMLVFIFVWSDFMINLNLGGTETRTIPVAITTYAQNEQVRYAEMAASSLLACIPSFLFLIFGQRYIIRGLLAGALK
jgi:multiple sugar transport system permease protein